MGLETFIGSSSLYILNNEINLNEGRADAKMESNPIGEFSEYQFTVDNLEQFSGFTIKIVITSTNECVPVRLKDFRAIALA